jgi:hypothetical protein
MLRTRCRCTSAKGTRGQAMILVWEPIAGYAVDVPDWDARRTYLRAQDAAPVRLTLAVKEHVRGALVRCQDTPGEPWYCADCLADLPGGLEAQDAHECGAGPEEGDLVWYDGALPAGYGRLYEVTCVQPGGRLRLWDMGNALDVWPEQVIIVRCAAARREPDHRRRD